MQTKKNLKPLNIKVDSRSPLPVYEQVKQEIKLLIVTGYLEEDDRLPPIRELATKLRINANTIVKVYYQLDVEGFLYSQPGSGYFVRGGRAAAPEENKKLLNQLTEEFLSKALKLGFSLREVIDSIEERGADGAGNQASTAGNGNGGE